MQADIGLIGLAVMGQNLVMNINDHGFRVAVFNRTTSKVDEFLAGAAKDSNVIGTHSLEELIGCLNKPRKIMFMVKAGEVVDALIDQLLPLLDQGDILIDGGNSLFSDTNRRCNALDNKGILYLGCGISGGEEGARKGPSIMPGGNKKAWPAVQQILQEISAKVDGEPCCQWMGEQGAGHYVKMVHNGIEYGDMQLICEAYQLMREGLGMDCDEIHEVFASWNEGLLDSYLVEITAHILTFKDEDGEPLLDKILDKAGQKGTGKWTAINALDLGIPLTLIAESVFSRCLSAIKDERLLAAARMSSSKPAWQGDRQQVIDDLHDALYASKIISYTQGFMLMREAAAEYGWQLNFGNIALMWRGGCIIRSRFLADIKSAYQQDPQLQNLLFNDFFADALKSADSGWRRTIQLAIEQSIPVPTFSAALSFFDGYRSARLPANLLQAQRDYFGAHTYQRIDRPQGEYFHTDWISSGGKVSSSNYDV